MDDTKIRSKRAAQRFGWTIVAYGEAAKSLSSLMQAIDQTAVRYGEYNAQLALAQGQAEVVQTQGDLRRSKELGPELANFVRAESELQQSFEDFKAQMLEKMLPTVTLILRAIEGSMDTGATIADAISVLGAPLTSLSPMAEAIRIFVNLMEDEKRPPPDDPTSMILNNEVKAPIG